MRRRLLLMLLAVACVSAGAQTAPSPYVTITAASCLKDAFNHPLAKGTLTVTPSAGNAVSVPFSVAGDLATGGSTTLNILNGSLVGTLQIANPAVTDPLHMGYTFVIANAATGERSTIKNALVDDGGTGTFNLCSLSSTHYSAATPVTLITGPAGPSGLSTLLASLPDCTGATHALNFSASTHTFTCITVGGVSTAPASSIYLLDSSTSPGTYYTLSFVSGGFTIRAVNSAPSGGASAATLIDSVSGQMYTLSINAGGLYLTTASSGGVAALAFADTVSGSTYTLRIISGGLNITP
jgi:hypothetical protein